MIYCFGDIHLSVENPWNPLINEKIINLFESFNSDPNKDTCILTGDILHKAYTYSECYSYVLRLFKILNSKFKNTLCLLGNHDFSYIKGKVTNALSIIIDNKNIYSNIEIIVEPKYVTIEDMHIYLVPYLSKLINNNLNLKEVFNITKKIDLLVGHGFIKNTTKFNFQDSWDIPNIHMIDNICLGHYHISDDKFYIGSIIPTAISSKLTGINYSQDYINVWGYEKVQNKVIKKEIKIPKILKFEKITYPNKIHQQLINDKNTVYVFVVYCDQHINKLNIIDFYSKQINPFFLHSIQLNLKLNTNSYLHSIANRNLESKQNIDSINIESLFKLFLEHKKSEYSKELIDLSLEKFKQFV